MIPKVSVIVPIYNVEHYFMRCIESLIHQSLKDIEIIFVDDESPDNCPKICDEYAKEYANIKVIHKKNQGLGMARNSGLEIATGEYVAFLDSDDFVDTAMYEALYRKAKDKEILNVYLCMPIKMSLFLRGTTHEEYLLICWDHPLNTDPMLSIKCQCGKQYIEEA